MGLEGVAEGATVSLTETFEPSEGMLEGVEEGAVVGRGEGAADGGGEE